MDHPDGHFTRDVGYQEDGTQHCLPAVARKGFLKTALDSGASLTTCAAYRLLLSWVTELGRDDEATRRIAARKRRQE